MYVTAGFPFNGTNALLSFFVISFSLEPVPEVVSKTL